MVAVQNYVTTQQEVSFAVAFSQAMRSQRTASTVQILMNAMYLIYHPVTAMPLVPTPTVATSAHALRGTQEMDCFVHLSHTVVWETTVT